MIFFALYPSNLKVSYCSLIYENTRLNNKEYVYITLSTFLFSTMEIALNTVGSDLKYFSFLGFMCVVISMTFYQLAVSTSKASVVAVLFSCNPVFVMFFAYILLKEDIHKNNIISLILEILGILIIRNPLHTKLNLNV